MTPIPPEAVRVVLAAVVPCAQKFTECRDRAYRCEECNGDGTRTVVTDIEVRRYSGVIDNAAGPTVWREVER